MRLEAPDFSRVRLHIARQISYTSDFERIKIGAIIVKKKDIVSVGCNLKKSHPIQKELNRLREDPFHWTCSYLHAEMAAILKSRIELSGASIYVYREDRNKNLARCLPCPACMKAIKDAGISDIYYTDIDGYHHKNI